MREGGNGRGSVPPGGDTFAPGDRVFTVADNWPGTVVSVDRDAGTVTIQWADGMFPVVWPDNPEMIRKAWPWED